MKRETGKLKKIHHKGRGRPTLKAEAYELSGLLLAIQNVENTRGTKLLERWLEQAWDNPKAMTAVIKKLIPDKHHLEIPLNDYLEAISTVFEKRKAKQSKE